MEALKIEPEVSMEERLSKVEGDVANILNRQDQFMTAIQQTNQSVGILATSMKVMQESVITFKDSMQESMRTFMQSMDTFRKSIEASQKANQDRWNTIKSFIKEYWPHFIIGVFVVAGAIYGLGYLMGAYHMQPLVHLPIVPGQ